MDNSLTSTGHTDRRPAWAGDNDVRFRQKSRKTETYRVQYTIYVLLLNIIIHRTDFLRSNIVAKRDSIETRIKGRRCFVRYQFQGPSVPSARLRTCGR